MRFVGRGHAAIRATHHKTLELTADPELTERGTCIVTVGAEPEPATPMAGPIRVRISAGAERFGFVALANSSWEPGGPVVIRRSGLRRPGTFATDATAASSDLPRPLVAALQSPDTLVTVDVAPIPPTQPTIVLLAADATRGPDDRLRAELASADAVIAEDAAAARLTGAATSRPDALRTLVVATQDLPGRTVLDRLAAHLVDTAGLPAALAVAAACPSRAPLVLALDADPRVVLRATPSTHRVVIAVEHDRLPALLELAARERGSGGATIAQEFMRPVSAAPDALPELPSRAPVYCCLHPVAADGAIEPAARAAIDALLADGVPTRTAAKALAALTGLDRRRAYDTIVHWTRS